VREAYVLTLLAVLAWTTGPVGSKAALLASGRGPALTPLQVAFWAIGIGWLALLGYLAVRRRLGLLAGVTGRGWLVLVGMGLFGWVGYPVAINHAYTRLPLSDALIISYVNPVLVTVLQAGWFGRLVRLVSGWEQEPDKQPQVQPALVAAGLALCLLGVAVTATQGHLGALGRLHLGAGALAALFAALSWAVYSNLGRFVPMRPGYGARRLGDVQNFAAMSCGLLAMGAMLGASGQWHFPGGYQVVLHLGSWGAARVEVWAVILVMGVINYCVGYPLWLQALELGAHAGGAHKLPPLNYLLLITSIGLGWLVLRQPCGEGFWQGGVLILAGNALTMWPGRRASGYIRE